LQQGPWTVDELWLTALDASIRGAKNPKEQTGGGKKRPQDDVREKEEAV
jgi:hypothetical protein